MENLSDKTIEKFQNLFTGFTKAYGTFEINKSKNDKKKKGRALTVRMKINFEHYKKFSNNIYLEIDHKLQSKCLNEIYKTVFSMNEKYNTKFINFSSENMISTAHKLVHFGWKKEAIPISVAKKSFIAGLFDRIFG